jgi:hypothetical protein
MDISYESIAERIKEILKEDDPSSDSPYWELMNFCFLLKWEAYNEGMIMGLTW